VKVSVPRERTPGERRVALVPDTVRQLVSAGLNLCVESGAGEGSRHPDAAYAEAGAQVVSSPAELGAEAAALVCVRTPAGELLDALPSGALLLGLLQPLSDPQGMAELAQRGLSVFALEALPRITRAQPMDALSSQATVSGYHAALLGATRLPRFFPLLMTAAGTIPPARVLVLGAGVAGLQAIATSRRLGAIVEAYDVRPAVKEQVESLGASFVELPLEESGEGAGGYARELTEETQRRQTELLAKHVAGADVVITTALIPGRPAPLLITREMVERMKSGSLVIDLAAEAGGNCELTQAGEEVEHGGVSVLGPLELPGTHAVHASQMYSRNVSSLLLLMVREGELHLDLEDEVLAGCCIAHGGEVVHGAVREKLATV
jgi:H+-translocating NAD(P) transhydrogenase subunit alpha